jgi:hypothetical protein
MSELTKTTDTIDRGTGEWRNSSGNLQNLTVKVWPDGIWLTGSLAKFHLGSNIETLPWKETASAVEHLSDELNQPMAHARVFRLDVAQTFAMERPPSDYFRSFLAPPRMNRHEYRSETLTFFNGQRSIVFYDKLAEMRRKRERLDDRAENGGPSRFHGHSNLLRYEVQFKKSLGRAFDERELRAASLSDSEFYEKVVRKWEEQYFKLGRACLVRRPVGRTSVKSDVEFLAALGLGHFGPQQYLDAITSDLRAGLIDKYQANRKRMKIRELAKGGGITSVGDVLEELDSKVRQAVALCE